MRPGGIEGGIGDQHDEIVIVTRDEVGPDGFALKYLYRPAVDAGGSGLHAAGYVERDGETKGALGGEGEARDRFEHEVVIDGAFDAEIVECVFRTLDDGATTSRARGEAGPGIEVGSIIVVAQFSGEDLLVSDGIVENVESAELHTRDRHIEHADFSVAGDEVVHQPGDEAVREIA